jgi:uncharacterized protein YcfL
MKTTKNGRSALAAALLAGAWHSGCTSPPLGTATNTYVGEVSGKEERFIGDRDLESKFVLLNIKTEQGERTRAQFDLQNTTSGDLRVEWAISWEDQNGFQVDTDEHWTPLVVSGKAFQAIQVIAPTSDAKHFRLHLRKPTPIR